MNPETIDNEYTKLEQEANQTSQAVQALAGKLQEAANAGDANAREWMLDLKSIALQVQKEQIQMQALLQAMHDFTVSHLSEPPPQQQYAAPAYPTQPTYAPQPAYTVQQPMGGGMLSRFLGGGFGRAVAMGAGFGIGDDIINSIF